MIVTILIELGLASWVLARYTLSSQRRVVVALLVALAGFQIAEYGVCSGAEATLLWSRLGYILITLLPALGLHLIGLLSHRPARFVTRAVYVVAGGLALTLAVVPSTLNQAICTGNYTIFHLSEPFNAIWSLYYGLTLLTGLAWALVSSSLASGHRKKALLWLSVGYASFMIPSIIIYYWQPTVRAGIPSIMCGFAVILALILGLKITPLTNRS